MVEVKRIKAPSDLPAEGSYVLVLYGPSAMDREHPRGRTLMVRDGKRDKVKLDEFASHLPSLAGRPHLSSSGWLFCRKQNPEIIAVTAGSACASLNLRRSPEAPVPRRPMRLLSGSLES